MYNECKLKTQLILHRRIYTYSKLNKTLFDTERQQKMNERVKNVIFTILLTTCEIK